MEHPKIKLGGQDYPVKPLVVRQLRVVIPALMRLRAARLDAITQEQFDDLAEIVFQAVSTGTPGLTREAYLELPIRAIDLMNAVPVIGSQAGMTEEAEPGEA
jgi:hypothetical protein